MGLRLISAGLSGLSIRSLYLYIVPAALLSIKNATASEPSRLETHMAQK